MNYLFNNDLVGKGKDWGHIKDLLPWQLVIYHRYNNMCQRCTNPNSRSYKTYGAIGIENHFTSLSHYYYSLKKLPEFKDFCRHPDKYHIDKDIKCGHGSHYSPSTISIVPYEENIGERNVRCNNVGRHCRKVILDGVTYESLKSASFGIPAGYSNMDKHARGYKSVHGVKVPLSHDFFDNMGVPHHIEYV